MLINDEIEVVFEPPLLCVDTKYPHALQGGGMHQGDPNRLEEYVTLRDELRELHIHGRQILYWTSALVFAALAWFLGKSEVPHIGPALFAFFLILVLAASFLMYINSLSQAFRIGGYLAVFWESRDQDRRLKWHRFNRRGAPGGLLTLAAQLAYAALSLLIVLFLLYSFETASVENRSLIILITIFGVVEMGAFTQLNNILRNRQKDYEDEWLEIRASRTRQDEIHDAYDTYRNRLIDANGSSLLHTE